MNKFLQKLLFTGKLKSPQGDIIDLFPTSSTPETLKLLHLICVKEKIKNSLEIGLAYGLGSLAIMSGLDKTKNPIHTSLDPHQESGFNNLGLFVVKAGNENCNFNFAEKDSIEFLQNYQSEKFDLVFIDGLHTYEQVSKEVTLVYQNLANDGIIVFDDTYLPEVRKVIKESLKSYPDLKEYSLASFKVSNFKKKWQRVIRRVLSSGGLSNLKYSLNGHNIFALQRVR